MAKRKSGNSQKKQPTFNPKDARPKPVLGTSFLIVGVFILLSLLTYDYAQNPVFRQPVESEPLMGGVGLQVGYRGFEILGLAAWLVPAFLFWLSAMYFFAMAHKVRIIKFALVLLSVAVAAIVGALIESFVAGNPEAAMAARTNNNLPHGPGGWLGHFVYSEYLHESIGMLGTAVIFGLVLAASLVGLFYDNVLLIFTRSFRGFGAWRKAQADRRAARREERRKEKERQAVLKKTQEKARPEKETRSKKKRKKAEPAAPEEEPLPVAADAPPRGKKRKLLLGMREKQEQKAEEKDENPLIGEPEPPMEEEDRNGGRSNQSINGASKKEQASRKADGGGVRQGLKIIASEQTRKASVPLPDRKGDYTFPPMKLLAETESAPESDSSEAHQQTAEMLVRTLGEFGVKVTMGEVHAGPVITRYDVYPAAGVRVEKIQNLDKNLALGLKALSVRILAPVPGKGCVGIEIPNKQPQSVCIRDILESEDWVNNKAEIPIALGKEVSGKPLIADLTKMPHLLIAGSTGSGKTVCINSVIASLLYKASPDDVRFVMVDPKIVEMQVYNNLPHMMIPVVTDPKKVPGALKYMLNEMERRYQMFAQLGVRNIAGFNAKRSRDKDAEARAKEMEMELSPEERMAAAEASSISVPRDPNVELPEKLPYIICIVDELADLMMVAPADIETGIARLAQLARAAGIHLILATQRPSVNVITGVIKANLPSRISFKVASKVDSRTILDAGGADQLIGRGDMLFLPPGSADLVRSQGAFVSDEEINGIVDFIHDQNGEPIFDEAFQRSVEEGGEEEEGGGDDFGDEDSDPLLNDALEVIRTSKRASTSMLQRRLKIGYNRAARIMEELEDKGVVGPENGSSPREILMELE